MVKYKVFGMLVALAMVAGMVTQPRAEAQELRLYPLLDCVTYDQDTVTAYYGYINAETTTLNVPFGTNNIFMPAPFFRGQPTVFEPGIHHKVFSVTFPAASYVEWTLGDTAVRATDDPDFRCSQSQADVSITQSAAPDPVSAGQELTYTLKAENHSPDQATGVSVKDALPSGLDLVSANASQGSCSGTETISCALGTLDADQSETVSILVKPKNAGWLMNTASVSANELDSITLNNTASSSLTVVSPPSAATGPASDLTFVGATLGALVNPNGSETTYHFEYGKTDAYGESTQEQTAGSGMAAYFVQATLGALRPGTAYHYRIVATSEHGTAEGSDRTFTTPALAYARLTLTAKPAVLERGESTTLSGRLENQAGDALASKEVVLRQKPRGADRFTPVRTATTGTDGAFAFKRIRPEETTMYRVMFAGDKSMGLRKTPGPARRVKVED
jgi:uncharacterized repeat protein (TIGR01451 family)